jgi:hypothetical protein
MIRFEICNVYFVERAPFSHIRDHDGAFENVIETQIIRPQDSADIFERLFGFGFQTARSQFHFARNHPDGTG